MNGGIIGLLLKRDIARVAQAGALTGSVAGFAGLIVANGSGAAAGATAAGWTWLLVATLPLALVLVAALETRRTDAAPYAAPNTWALIRILLVIGIIGGLGAIVLEFVVASYIPALFSFFRLDVVAVRAALVGNYPLLAIPVALGATAIAAIAGGMVFRRTSGGG